MCDPMQSVRRVGDCGIGLVPCPTRIGPSAPPHAKGRMGPGPIAGPWPPTIAALGGRAEVDADLIDSTKGRPIRRSGDDTVAKEAVSRTAARVVRPRTA